MKRSTMWLLKVFGQPWSSVAQRNNIYQALATQAVLFSRISVLSGFSLDLLTIKKIWIMNTLIL